MGEMLHWDPAHMYNIHSRQMWEMAAIYIHVYIYMSHSQNSQRFFQWHWGISEHRYFSIFIFIITGLIPVNKEKIKSKLNIFTFVGIMYR